MAAALLWLLLAAGLRAGEPAPQVFSLGLAEAESRALLASDQVKAAAAEARAAQEQAQAQFAGVLPRLSLEASYGYLTNVPSLQLSPLMPAPIQFGTHENYSIGPRLTYTLWDTGSAWKAYRGFAQQAAARGEDRRATERALRQAVDSVYVRVQLALEELRLFADSLALARAQNRDIETNFKAGAANRLDLLDSRREVLSYQLQFRQRRSDLSSALQDLVALVGAAPGDLSRPGPPDFEDLTLALKLDPQEDSLASAEGWPLAPPDSGHPQVRAQELQARAADLAAQSQNASLYPVVTATAKASEDYPNAILPQTVQQNTFALSLSWPLFEGGRARHLTDERRREADAARRRAAQLLTDLRRDYDRAGTLAADLRQRRELAAQDVAASQEAARLYYQSYKAGRINLIDVQSADLRALQSKVGAADIAAQLLQQLVTLRALSGGSDHGQ